MKKPVENGTTPRAEVKAQATTTTGGTDASSRILSANVTATWLESKWEDCANPRGGVRCRVRQKVPPGASEPPRDLPDTAPLPGLRETPAKLSRSTTAKILASLTQPGAVRPRPGDTIQCLDPLLESHAGLESGIPKRPCNATGLYFQALVLTRWGRGH